MKWNNCLKVITKAEGLILFTTNFYITDVRNKLHLLTPQNLAGPLIKKSRPVSNPRKMSGSENLNIFHDGKREKSQVPPSKSLFRVQIKRLTVIFLAILTKDYFCAKIVMFSNPCFKQILAEPQKWGHVRIYAG